MSFLDSVELFDFLDSNEKDTISVFCQERFLRAGEVLFHEWDDALALYIVKEGLLKVYKDRSDGQKVLGNIGANEMSGEMALFDPGVPKKRTASVMAVNDTFLIVIMDYAILELSRKHHHIYQKIVDIIMKRKENTL